jgi:hypothetical protein
MVIILIVGLLLIALWFGLRVKPAPFPAYEQQTPPFECVPLPDNLPAPVERFFRVSIGDQVPVIHSAVLTGVAKIRFMGIPFLGRLRFTHRAGYDYRHYMETTLFGFPLMKVNESYRDGKGRLELPFGVITNEPKVDSAANLGLWGETIWLPSLFVTDPRVRWEAIDDTSARLIVPYGDEEDSFTVTFDPQTGLLKRMEALRWKDAKDTAKTRWTLEPLGWKTYHGMKLPSPASATWETEGTPWLVSSLTDVVYNVDVSEYVRARGL